VKIKPKTGEQRQILDGQTVTSYTCWADAVQVQGAETQVFEWSAEAHFYYKKYG
jgi:hypothetical protein